MYKDKYNAEQWQYQGYGNKSSEISKMLHGNPAYTNKSIPESVKGFTQLTVKYS